MIIEKKCIVLSDEKTFQTRNPAVGVEVVDVNDPIFSINSDQARKFIRKVIPTGAGVCRYYKVGFATSVDKQTAAAFVIYLLKEHEGHKDDETDLSAWQKYKTFTLVFPEKPQGSLIYADLCYTEGGVIEGRAFDDLGNEINLELSFPGRDLVPQSPPPVKKPCSPTRHPRPLLDENVQFTVFRPRVVAPEIWCPLLAFAHLAERRPDAPPEELDPVEQVKRQAEKVLDEKYPQYQELVQDSAQGIPREGELTFLPEIPGFEFNPPRRTFFWQESVHREEFRMRAPRNLDGQTVRGRLSVFLGCILVAEIPLSIKVNRQEAVKTPEPHLESVGAKAYRNIFASYSRKDLAIVNEFEQYLMDIGLGDKYLRDLMELRVGEEWNTRLMELIREANIFQLFWSWNSMISPFVEQEYRYALSLNRAHFVRPVYWEEPLPKLEEKNLPPEELRRLHFVKVYPRITPAAVPVQSDTIATDGKELLSRKIRGLERGKDAPAENMHRTSSPIASSPIKMPPVTFEPPSPLGGEYTFKGTRFIYRVSSILFLGNRCPGDSDHFDY